MDRTVCIPCIVSRNHTKVGEEGIVQGPGHFAIILYDPLPTEGTKELLAEFSTRALDSFLSRRICSVAIEMFYTGLLF